MQTVTINTYKFSELSDEAKQVAIEAYREHVDNSYIYNEAHETVKAFENIFPVDSRGRNSWLSCNTNSIDDNINELQGHRLRTYIYNNFGYALYKPAYIGNIKREGPVTHRRVKSQKLSNGRYFNPYYSAIKKDTCCVLTGVCYDDSMLKPIYQFLDLKGSLVGYNFSDLMEACYNNLERVLKSEEEYLYSDEAIIETLEDNDYNFLDTGKIW
jgi:hypothetical protein